MNKDFLNSLPSYYEDVREFNELDTVVSERYTRIDEAFDSLEKDQFVLTSSEAATAIRERDFAIRANPKNETLDYRKARLLTHMQSKPPYVYKYLLKLLSTLLGENSHEVKLDINEFEMEVFINVNKSAIYDEVYRLLERVVPLNILIDLALVLNKHMLTMQHFRYNYPLYYGLCGVMVTEPIMGVGVGSVMTMKKHMYDYPIYYSPTDTFNTEPMLGVGVGSKFVMRDFFTSAPLYYPATNVLNTDGIKGHRGKIDTNVAHHFNQMITPYPVCGEFRTGGIA